MIKKFITFSTILFMTYCDLIGYNRMGNRVKTHYSNRLNSQPSAVDPRLVKWLMNAPRARQKDDSLTDLFRLFSAARPRKLFDGGNRLNTYLKSMTAILYQ